MKVPARAVLLVVASLLSLAACWVGLAAQAQEKLKPLVVDKNAPLLLPDAPASVADPWDEPSRPLADNSACFVCHDQYRQEELATVHAKVNVGCIKCHGESLAHRNDEDNITPPDVMFAEDTIEKSCQECHDTHDAPARDVLARWQERCPAKSDPARIVCTDCHGQHRMAFHTVWWDKKTRKLAPRAPGERIKVREDLTQPAAEAGKTQ